jgi:APA family basic amino acid/polyamine antiporter
VKGIDVTHRRMTLSTGVGLVAANMIGAGVFISAGFMAQDLGPKAILLAWVVGAIIALAGARAYAEVATLVPRSGGEYRYLSELMHPFMGCLAGWASLLVGFSAPLAIDAVAAGSFLKILGIGHDPRHAGALLVLGLTCVHAFDFRLSNYSQNLFVVLKVLLVVSFVGLGLVLGSGSWPVWSPPRVQGAGTVPAFMTSLFFIAFAFSGWNAAAYVAEEFESPRRTVPRAMLIGCALVAVLYLAVNWVFVANLTPESASVVFSYETARVTLGHAVARQFAGETGAKVISGLMVVALVSSASAMTLVGPRVYAAMARDGFLPQVLAGKSGTPPAGSVLLQGALALVLIYAQELSAVLQNLGAILTLFSALTVACLFRVWIRPGEFERPRPAALVAAAIHILSAIWMLYFGFRSSTHLLVWVSVVVMVTFVAYTATSNSRGRRSAKLGGERPRSGQVR